MTIKKAHFPFARIKNEILHTSQFSERTIPRIDNIVFISVSISILFNFPCVIRPSIEHLTIHVFF